MAIIRSRPGLLKKRLANLFLIICVGALVVFLLNVAKDWYYQGNPLRVGSSNIETKNVEAHRRRPHIKHDSAEDDAVFQVQVCKVPKLSLETDANRFAFEAQPPLHCEGEDLWYTQNGVLTINETVLRGRKIEKCEYRAIAWQTDDFYVYSQTHTRKEDPFELKIKHDFFRVECYLEKTADKERPKHERRLFGVIEEDRMLDHKNAQDTLGRPRMIGSMNLPDIPNSVLSKNGKNERSDNKVKIKNDIVNEVNKPEKVKDEVAGDNKVKIKNDKENEVNKPIEVKDEVAEENDVTAKYRDEYDPNYYDYRMEGLADYDQFIAQIFPTKEILERLEHSKPKKHSTQMNVLIFALDSMSHLSYQRKLPKTYKYLKDTLGAKILNGYNIVGDATTAAMIPFLTGKTEIELPEARKGKPGSTYVDAFPFIWNFMEQSGYVTLYAEDQPSLGTWQLRLNGFEQPPVDHYIRPFWQAFHDSEIYKTSTRYCVGAKPQHQFTLEYLRDFFLRYRNTPKWGMGFLGELSHGDNNPAEYVDEDLVLFLNYLRKNGLLENTLLIVMGDHGARYSKVRRSVQGKLEERLPMMSLTFPQWFQDKYPHLMQNLEKNTERLTTPFDMHETMLDVLDTSRWDEPFNYKWRGISLLRQIPLNRTCSAAGIQTHWCSCLQFEEKAVDDPQVKEGAQQLLDEINRITANHRDKCRELTLKKIDDARMVIPNEDVLRFQKALDPDQRLANFSSKISLDVVRFQLIIVTSPNDGMYESTIQYQVKDKTWKVSVNDISRINIYGDQPHCIVKTSPELRKFCYCNQQLSKHRGKGKDL